MCCQLKNMSEQPLELCLIFMEPEEEIPNSFTVLRKDEEVPQVSGTARG